MIVGFKGSPYGNYFPIQIVNPTLDDLQKQLLEIYHTEFKGNKTKIAKAMNVNVRSIRNWYKQYSIKGVL